MPDLTKHMYMFRAQPWSWKRVTAHPRPRAVLFLPPTNLGQVFRPPTPTNRQPFCRLTNPLHGLASPPQAHPNS